MQKPHFTQGQLAQVAKLSDMDIVRINECRGIQNKIGFAYQLCYVKLFNRFPGQSPLEILDELATFVAIQRGIIFASKGADFAQAARTSTEQLRGEINRYR